MLLAGYINHPSHVLRYVLSVALQAGQLTKTKLEEAYPLGTFEQAIAVHNACDKLLCEMAQYWLQPGFLKQGQCSLGHTCLW